MSAVVVGVNFEPNEILCVQGCRKGYSVVHLDWFRALASFSRTSTLVERRTTMLWQILFTRAIHTGLRHFPHQSIR